MASSEADPKDRYSAGPRETGDSDGRSLPVPTAVVVAAVLVPLIMLGVVLVLVRNIGDDAAEAAASEPYAAVPLPAPGAESQVCSALIDALPPELGDAAQVALTDPAPAGVAAYRLPDAEPVIVRCGMPAPPTFVVGVGLQVVNEVEWFQQDDPDPAVTSSTWVAVDRSEFIAVTLPNGSGTGPIQELSDAISASTDKVEPSPAPIG